MLCNMFASGCDVLVAGAGPSGLALAAACASQGLRVTCVAPEPRAAWMRTFGVWSTELEQMEDAVVETEWARPTVWIDDRTKLSLTSGYARLDVARTHGAVLRRVEALGVKLVAGSVMSVSHQPRGSRVVLGSGRSIDARIVVDATGPSSTLVPRSRHGAPAFQTAYGEVVETDAPAEMAFMDYRGPAADPPSFLYALPLPDGRVFFEETVLASRPRVSMSLLRSRLRARLVGMGHGRARTLEKERCVIPLGVPLPLPGRVIPFGAAASLVHPATGYQLARCFALAPGLATAIARDEPPAVVAQRAYEVLWPASRRRAWALYTFGMEVICSLDQAHLRSFMRAFFRLPEAEANAYLRGTLPASRILVAMTRVLANADAPVRSSLIRMLARNYKTITRPLLAEEAS